MQYARLIIKFHNHILLIDIQPQIVHKAIDMRKKRAPKFRHQPLKINYI